MSSHVTLVGNLTRDPELRFTTGGRGACSFGVAVNRRFQQNGEWTEQTSFYNITAWGDLGEHIAECLRKGDRVLIAGRLEQRSWEDKDAGQSRSTVEVIADEVGPSLRWATTTITRVERQTADA